MSLAGKCTLPFEGTVTINGRNVRDLTGAEIVPQFDVFTDSLTVMERLVFMVSLTWKYFDFFFVNSDKKRPLVLAVCVKKIYVLFKILHLLVSIQEFV